MSDGPEFQLPDLARALKHTIRVEILTTLLHRDEICPQEIADRTGSPLSRVSYHFRFLQGMEMVELERTVPRRGAIQHYYSLRDEARRALRPASELLPRSEEPDSDGRRDRKRRKR